MSEQSPFFASSSTRVIPLARVEVTRLLPRTGQLHVRQGQVVTAGQILGRCAPADRVHLVPAAQMLGVGPDELPHFVVPTVGATLQRGDLLLSRPGRFGRNSVYRSRVAGVLSHVTKGMLVIRPVSGLYELPAMVSGLATRLFPGQGVILETNATLIQVWWHSGYESRGPLQVLTEDPSAELSAADVEAAARDSVILVGRIGSPRLIGRLASAGVSGIISGSATAAVARQALQQALPLVLTEGIGELPMAAPIFDLLRQAQERATALLAARSGRRPQVVIAVPTEYEAPALQPVRPLKVGQMVRIWRQESRPHVGRVRRIHDQPQRTGLGQPMAGADIELADGQEVFVPFTNLDAIHTE